MQQAVAPNPNDYAIVVGITLYPGLLGEDSKPRCLEGPVNDALGIRDWLLDPDGGGLDPAKLRLLCSDTSVPGAAEPTRFAIEAAFEWLIDETAAGNGRRLYVYMSGHGFSRDFNKACLIAADYTEDRTANIFVTEWVNSLIKCRRFAEYVLWFDGCMVQMSIAEGGVTMKQCPAHASPSPQMFGFATMSGLKALEFPIAESGGRVHGAFTWTLLQGLRKLGAPDAEKLKSHVLNTMRDLIPAEYRNVPEYKVEPRIDVLPQSLPEGTFVFGRRAAKQPKVTFGLGNASPGQQLRVWGGTPLTMVASGPLGANGLTLDLPRGIYVADVAAAGLRQGFEVDGTRDVAVELDEKGDPPKIPPDPQPKLSIEASNVAASITLINCRFDKVLQSTGFYGGRQAAGVYKIRVQYGQEIADVSERIILLDRDADQLTIAGPMVRSPVPTRGTAFIHEFHELAADRLADLPAPPGRPAAETCGLAVLARYWTGNPPTVTDPSRFPHPFDGLSLHTLKGAPIADLASDSGTALVSSNGLDPVATLQLPLDTGTYILRQSLPDGRTIDRSVVLAPGWVTEVYIQRSNDDLVPSEAARVRSMGSVRLLMRRPGTHISSAGVGNDNEALEIAYQALGSGKRLLTQTGAGSLEALLLAKFENPIAGIVGALLLISECDQSPDPVQRDRCLAPLDETVRNLRRLVGSSHPDVEAISMRCPDPTLHSSSPVMVPPMFSRSWAAAVHSAAGHRTLAGPVWNRIKAKVSDPLYLVWSSDERTRAVYEQSLTESVRSTFAAAAAPRRGRLRARASAPAAGAPSFELEMALPAADAALAEAVATFERLQVPIAEIERMAATKAHQDEPELSQEPRHEPE